MEAIKCDVCNGALEMEAGGRTATCVVCGMRYSVERLQEKLCATQNFEGGINVGNIKISEDAEQLKTLLVKYLDSFDYNNALHIINRILEAAPTDAEANKIYDRLQELKYFEIKNKVLVKYSGTSKDITIPDGVTEIGKNAFSLRQDDDGKSIEGANIETLVMPDSVSVIGDFAFTMCEKLKEIQWSKNLLEIGESAFYNTAISELVLPPKVEVIKAEAFMHCHNLKKIILPDSVSDIGAYAFSYTEIKTINIPDNVTTLCHYVLGGSKIESVVIPDSVTTIETCAFTGCEQLAHVEIGCNVKSIGGAAFYRTAISEITIPASVEEVGGQERVSYYTNYGAFSNCANLRVVNILSENLNNKEDIIFASTPYISEQRQRAYEQRQREEAERERRRQEEERQEDLRRKAARRQKGVCQYCGSTFNGLFTKKCSNCGRVKDY